MDDTQEIFRIDCKVEPFEPRRINGLPFEKSFDNPLRPSHPTGLFYYGPIERGHERLYEGLEHFPITRCGTTEDEEAAAAVHGELVKARGEEYRAAHRAKTAPAPDVAAAAAASNKGKGAKNAPAAAPEGETKP